MKINIVVTSFLVLIYSSLGHATPVVYYDVDFSSPTHSLNQVPATGSGFNTPSQIVFGQPIVQQSLGSLTNQPLVFNTLGNSPSFYYDQLEFGVGRGSSKYSLSFDLWTQDLVGSGNNFSLLFDTPVVQKISFDSNGEIRVDAGHFGQCLTKLCYSSVISGFRDEELLNVLIDIDIASSEWSVMVNDAHLFDGLFSASGGDIFSFRYSLGLQSSASSPNHLTYTGLDNIKMVDELRISPTGNVPEPSVLSLMLLGLVGLIMKTSWRLKEGYKQGGEHDECSG